MLDLDQERVLRSATYETVTCKVKGESQLTTSHLRILQLVALQYEQKPPG